MPEPASPPSSTGSKRRGAWVPRLILAAALIGAGALVWRKVIRLQIFPNNLGIVVDGEIYRSGQNTEGVLRRLCTDLRLRSIIDLGGEGGDSKTEAERRVAEEMGIRRYEFSLPGDGTGDADRWAAVLRLMSDPENHPMLVHCASGSQRSSTATLLYRHIVEGRPIVETYPESFEYQHRPDEWHLLAFLADALPQIEHAYRTDRPVAEDATDTITAYAETFLVNEP